LVRTLAGAVAGGLVTTADPKGVTTTPVIGRPLVASTTRPATRAVGGGSGNWAASTAVSRIEQVSNQPPPTFESYDKE